MPIPPTAALPVPASWDEFEALVAELCVREWATAHVFRHGRLGQAQQGVDIYGYVGGDKRRLACVQCKRVEQLVWSDIESTVDSALAFAPAPTEMCIATTAPTDARLQERIRLAQQDWPFLVHVRFWNDLHLAITRYPDLVEQFWPDRGARSTTISRVRDLILDSDPSAFKRANKGDEQRYVHQEDVNLAIVIPEDEGWDFSEEWIRTFPANALPPAPAPCIDVLVTYAGQVLAAFSFLYLDGARYLLPLPPAPAHVERLIDPIQAALGRIVGQSTSHSFDDGCRRAGMRLVPSHVASKRDWLR